VTGADLIVFNLERDEATNRILYWLQSIASRASSAPVIFVGTHLDSVGEHRAQMYLYELKQKYIHYSSFLSFLSR
jgi:hypothetical protein